MNSRFFKFQIWGWVVALALMLMHCGNVPPVQVRMTGTDHRWKVAYAGPDGVWNTSDDLASADSLKLPALTPVILTLESTDYIYTFSLPQLDLKQMAVPELQYKLSFKTPKAGLYRIDGGQMCGLPIIGNLSGQMVIEKRKDFQGFLNHLEKGAAEHIAKKGLGKKPNPNLEKP